MPDSGHFSIKNPLYWSGTLLAIVFLLIEKFLKTTRNRQGKSADGNVRAFLFFRWKVLLVLVFAVLPSHLTFAAGTNNPTVELQALVAKINTDLEAGKHTEADLSDDLKQFDALLAEHKGEKTDAVAQILVAEAMLYSDVLNDGDKSEALMHQLTNDFSGTPLVIHIQQEEAKQAAGIKMQSALVEGASFPDFQEKDVMGNPLSIANYKGKVVLIDFWATWCVPCRMQLPGVIAAYQKYHSQGFEVIGVSLDQDQQTMLNFTKENDMPWPEYFDGMGWGNELAVKYGIQSIPQNYLLDGNGKIIGRDLAGQDLMDAVAKAVGKK
jgi:thiol-disulfide isomerase/thioredoxin